MKITAWYVLKENGDIIFNHIEDDWKYGNFPLPLKPEFTNQKAWQNQKWLKRHCFLINGKVEKS